MLSQSYAQTFLASPPHNITATGREAVGGSGEVWPLGLEVTATVCLWGPEGGVCAQCSAGLPVSPWERSVSAESPAWASRRHRGVGASACAAGPVHSSGFLGQEGKVESRHCPLLLHASPNVFIPHRTAALGKRM